MFYDVFGKMCIKHAIWENSLSCLGKMTAKPVNHCQFTLFLECFDTVTLVTGWLWKCQCQNIESASMHVLPKISVCLCLRVSAFSRQQGEREVAVFIPRSFAWWTSLQLCSSTETPLSESQILESGREASISQACVTANDQTIHFHHWHLNTRRTRRLF